ncbi:MAG: four-carbon acid sugar kinase family protein [Geminicoccaceae bacterium]
MSRSLGIVADDFTGALMVAGYIEGAGIYCPVVFDPAAVAPGAPVIVGGTRTRTVPVADALTQLRRMAEALLEAGYARLAYKACATFDSTEAGNIGPAADFLADRLGLRPVLMSAGFPRYGTTVHQGYLFYRGRLVSESIKRFDPLTPMPDPDLVRFLSLQTPHRIGLVPHATLLRGVEAAGQAVAALAAEGHGHVFFDTTDDNDAEIAAEIAAATPCIVAASDPLIVDYAIGLARAAAAAPVPPPRHAPGPAAVIAGTVGPVILKQLDVFGAAHPVLTIDLLDPGGEEATIAAALDWATPLIGSQPFAMSSATDQAGVERTQAALGPIGAARRAERLLGAIAAGLRDRGVNRFVVVGGETSGAVISALGIAAVRAIAEGPLGTGFCVAGGARPTSLYLKPGKLGSDDILLRALDAMGD